MFKLKTDYKLTLDQQGAVTSLSNGIKKKKEDQVLLGVTGSGKTFTIANVIEKTKLPTLVLAHNKTLAGQLYQEMKEFFPEAAISYFVSYYDYYQPEAYIAATDSYIEKEATINEFIDKLRLQTTSNILSRDDVVVVSSVSCIYSIGPAQEFERFSMGVNLGQSLKQEAIIKKLVDLQYTRGQFEFKRGSFRIRGRQIDIYPASEDYGIRVSLEDEIVSSIIIFDPLTGKKISDKSDTRIFSTKHYLIDTEAFKNAEEQIASDLEKEASELRKQKKNLEAERLVKRVNFDLEMMREVGYVNGIENYSRYFDGRSIGQAPYTLLDYFIHRFGKEWLLVVDESHMTIPQLNGMYNGDRARKQVLVENGFRLKSAFDNRPLRFEEFLVKKPQTIYVSATPSAWELQKSKNSVVEQLVRPTGIVDPEIEIRLSSSEVDDVLVEIEKVVNKGGRVLVTTLTKQISEDLTDYLKQKKIRAEYLHADVKTLERGRILQRLRRQEFDVLVGINLLREGLDLPEVTLVAILDADKEGFLRSRVSLIQTMGRAARNTEGRVILYADKLTDSMKEAIQEVNRRRAYQTGYNSRHKLTPYTIVKSVRDTFAGGEEILPETDHIKLPSTQDIESLTPHDLSKLTKKMTVQMKAQAKLLNFEMAIILRDKVEELNKTL